MKLTLWCVCVCVCNEYMNKIKNEGDAEGKVRQSDCYSVLVKELCWHHRKQLTFQS